MVPTVALPADDLDFAWDRPETEDSLKKRLASSSHEEWLCTAAWIMREARVDQFWQFLTLQERILFPSSAPCSGVGVRCGIICFAPRMHWEDSKACTP